MKCTRENCEGELYSLSDIFGQPAKVLLSPNLMVDTLICPVCKRVCFFKNDEITQDTINQEEIKRVRNNG
jgi:hypothetical protein